MWNASRRPLPALLDLSSLLGKGTLLGLGTQPCYEAPSEPQVENVIHSD